MATAKKEYDLIKLYDKFIKQSKQGVRRQKNGKRVRSSTLDSYENLRKVLISFSIEKNVPLRIYSLKSFKTREIKSEKKYWKKFYDNFTDYMYDDCGYFDNYVGSLIKLFRTFFNYLNNECDLNVGNFHKDFYAPTENIEIVTLLPEQLNFLIYNKAFEESLPSYLKATKDMFVFGCTVALRFSDLVKLHETNLEVSNGKTYLKVSSIKTDTATSVLLPDYAVEILQKRHHKRKTLFTPISKDRFNDNVKQLIEKANWTDARTKTRKRRGVPVIVYKDPLKKEPYRFCDLISSHTMRRTAVTTMLCLHMPENVVRKISGHAANSKEFFRYVEISQKYSDAETEKIHALLKQKEIA